MAAESSWANLVRPGWADEDGDIKNGWEGGSGRCGNGFGAGGYPGARGGDKFCLDQVDMDQPESLDLSEPISDALWLNDI